MPTDDDTHSARDARRALLATSLGFGVVQLDVSVVNVAVQPIRDDLGGSITSLQWVVDAYTLAFAALILAAGALGDRLGARRVFVAGFALFTVASVACGLAPGLGALIGARVVQGVGAAVLVPCSLTLLNHAYPDADERTRAVGLWAAGASVGVAVGPLVGGALTTALDWRAVFFVNLPLGVAGIALTLRHATETTRSTDRSLDLPGQIFATLTLGLAAAATVEGGRRGFGDTLVLAGYAVAAVAAVAFVVVERRSARPMLPPHLFASRRFSAATTIGLGVNTAFYGLFFVLSLYFQSVRHYSVIGAGLALLPTAAAVLAGNLLAKSVAQRTGQAALLVGSAVAMGVGSLGLLVAGSGTTYVVLVAQLVVLGGGLGLIVPTMTTILLGSVDASYSGVASGTLNTARQTGSVIGVALFGSLASADVVGGLHVSLLVSAVLAGVVAVLATLTRADDV